ncbi:hypothetical protein COLO4_14273 [Corchorus olitorius]|uniref:Bifunctional inhibitor/plant lipid transfer protein/seed storage helical domain-containing protein n=1 Tax=Corchorus olitorius TaxID=93759 RepID=A0A1R3JSQ1_9ROSI|nr:hypothetical protein COLO4_14273 [Corchorus olitorius]
MAAVKSVVFSLLVVLVVVATVETQTAKAQSATCSNDLTNLNTCAPFVVPGAANPSPACCSALQAVQPDCLCNTLRIASQLPSRCNVQPFNCGN